MESVSGLAFWSAVVALSAVGALARYLVDLLISRHAAARLPLGTFVVNATGACGLGVLTGAAVGHGARLLLGTALIGSYSTFSTWMWETLVLAEDGRGRAFALNVAGQTAVGLALVAGGWWVGALL